MITTTWTKAPADLLGRGSSDVRRCTVQGTGVPAGGTAARLRPAFRPAGAQAQFAALAHNSIDDTTLGLCSSRRPPS